mgnify:CR=1 FL=1
MPDYLTKLNEIKKSIEDSFTTLGIDYSDSSFLNYANLIYNFGKETKKTFISEEKHPIPTGLGIKGLNDKIDYLDLVKTSIFNALHTRKINIATNVPFDKYSTYIDKLTEKSGQLELLEFNTSNNNGKIIIEFNSTLGEGNKYVYNTYSSLPASNTITGYKKLSANNRIYSIDEYTGYLYIVEVNSSNNIISGGFAKVSKYQDIREEADEYYFSSTPSTTEVYTSLINSNKNLDECNLYYIPYTDRKFYTDESIDESYTEIIDNKITFSDGESTKLTIVVVRDNHIIGYGDYISTPSRYADKIGFIDSYQGNEIGSFRIYTNNIKNYNNTYILVKDTDTEYLYNALIKDSDILKSNVELGTDINVGKNKTLVLIEVDSSNRVQKYGKFIPTLYIKYVDGFSSIKSETTNIFDETIITVTGKKDEKNKLYYKADIYDYNSIAVDTDISELTGYKLIIDNKINVKNGTLLAIIEVDSNNKVVSYGTVTAKCKSAFVNLASFISDIGSVTGYTKITPNKITKEKLESGDYKLFYYPAAITVSYYESINYNWFSWNGVSEIYGFRDKQVITIIACDEIDGSYYPRMVNVISVNVRPVELIILDISTIYGIKEFTTRLSINNNRRGTDNRYRYKFNIDKLPELYDKALNWTLWDGYSDIIACDKNKEAYNTICVVETDPNGLILKAGICNVHMKEADPVLGELEFGLYTDASHRYVTPMVSDKLTEGYIYLYSFVSQATEYHQDLNNWQQWDGISPINVPDSISVGSITFCLVEATIDKMAYRAGTVTVNYV